MRVSYTWIVTQIVDVLESERGGGWKMKRPLMWDPPVF